MYTLAVDVVHSIVVQVMPMLMVFAGIFGVLLIKLVPPLKRGAASTTSTGSSGREGEDQR